LLCIAEAINFGDVTRITGHRDLSPDIDKDGVVEPNEWVKQCPCFNAETEYNFLIPKDKRMD
jgi:N-acetylmuramoyl-L-alanine amidase